MKQLTKEEQEQAVELIEQSTTDLGDYINYIHSAKAFLQSLKPKIYVGQIRQANTILFFDRTSALTDDIQFAYSFIGIDAAKEFKDKCEINFPEYRHFLLTE